MNRQNFILRNFRYFFRIIFDNIRNGILLPKIKITVGEDQEFAKFLQSLQ